MAVAVMLAAALPAAAQDLSRPDTAAQRSPRLFTHRDLLIAGAFAAGTVAMFPLDRALARDLQDSTVQTSHLLSHGATAARVLGSPGGYVLPVAAYVGGRVLNRPHLADLGLHTTEAVVMATAITDAVKSLGGRARPQVSVDEPFDYGLGRGFRHSEFSSMPSGHTSKAFAAASAATSEVGQWWPAHRRAAGLVLYSTATLVGLSRMYNNKHWASDVVVGAAIGSFSGWKVVGYTHAHPGNRLDRFFLHARVGAGSNGGMAISWSSPTG
ncbi:MAG: phosphatase PAP2 family protein [Longimicrobiaceae bacterium]